MILSWRKEEGGRRKSEGGRRKAEVGRRKAETPIYKKKHRAGTWSHPFDRHVVPDNIPIVPVPTRRTLEESWTQI